MVSKEDFDDAINQAQQQKRDIQTQRTELQQRRRELEAVKIPRTQPRRLGRPKAETERFNREILERRRQKEGALREVSERETELRRADEQIEKRLADLTTSRKEFLRERERGRTRRERFEFFENEQGQRARFEPGKERGEILDEEGRPVGTTTRQAFAGQVTQRTEAVGTGISGGLLFADPSAFGGAREFTPSQTLRSGETLFLPLKETPQQSSIELQPPQVSFDVPPLEVQPTPTLRERIREQQERRGFIGGTFFAFGETFQGQFERLERRFAPRGQSFAGTGIISGGVQVAPFFIPAGVGPGIAVLGGGEILSRQFRGVEPFDPKRLAVGGLLAGTGALAFAPSVSRAFGFPRFESMVITRIKPDLPAKTVGRGRFIETESRVFTTARTPFSRRGFVTESQETTQILTRPRSRESFEFRTIADARTREATKLVTPRGRERILLGTEIEGRSLAGGLGIRRQVGQIKVIRQRDIGATLVEGREPILISGEAFGIQRGNILGTFGKTRVVEPRAFPSRATVGETFAQQRGRLFGIQRQGMGDFTGVTILKPPKIQEKLVSSGRVTRPSTPTPTVKQALVESQQSAVTTSQAQVSGIIKSQARISRPVAIQQPITRQAIRQGQDVAVLPVSASAQISAQRTRPRSLTRLRVDQVLTPRTREIETTRFLTTPRFAQGLGTAQRTRVVARTISPQEITPIIRTPTPTPPGQPPSIPFLIKFPSLKFTGVRSVGIPSVFKALSVPSFRALAFEEFGGLRKRDISGLRFAGLRQIPIKITFNERGLF